jgi:hypothetical protein
MGSIPSLLDTLPAGNVKFEKSVSSAKIEPGRCIAASAMDPRGPQGRSVDRQPSYLMFDYIVADVRSVASWQRSGFSRVAFFLNRGGGLGFKPRRSQDFVVSW